MQVFLLDGPDVLLGEDSRAGRHLTVVTVRRGPGAPDDSAKGEMLDYWKLAKYFTLE